MTTTAQRDGELVYLPITATPPWADEQSNEWFDRLRSRSVFLNAGPRAIEVTGHSLRLPVVTASVTVGARDDGTPITPTDPTLDARILEPVSFAGIGEVTNEVLADTGGQVLEILAQDLVAQTTTELDKAFFHDLFFLSPIVRPRPLQPYPRTPVPPTETNPTRIRGLLPSRTPSARGYAALHAYPLALPSPPSSRGADTLAPMTRVTLRYGGDEYVIRDSAEDALERLRLAIDGQVLDFRLSDRKTLHIRVSEYTPVAVIVTAGAETPLSPPNLVVSAMTTDDEPEPPLRF